ncbi:MAG: zinc ribbon domain-containing protein [Sulfurovum sp. PC08-66]|nr:MAG: zinc ribbon domain-containing protein [Sulfurovum sp. PC08-66]KIM12506.1 MAG: zinc ribbon domain-containing protein [Sulfuricurvum sp. PC08-66]
MNKHLQQLVELSEIDKQIDAFEPRLKAANTRLHKIEKEKETILAAQASLEREIEDATLKKRKNELHLAELGQKLKENSAKSSEIRNEREMKSLQLEEEIAKEQITFANEEIERLDKIISNRQAEIAKESERVETLSGQMQSLSDEVAHETATINKERQEVFGKKEALVATVNQKGLSFYEKIRRWAKNTTVVPVRKQACYGCYMKLNDKVYAEVIVGEEIVTCPHCGRILYKEPEVAQSA